MIESFVVLNQLLISYFHVEFPLVLVKLTNKKLDSIFQNGAIEIQTEYLFFTKLLLPSIFLFIEKSTPIILFFKRK